MVKKPRRDTCQAFSSVTRLLAHISQPGASSRSCWDSTNLAYLITLRPAASASSRVLFQKYCVRQEHSMLKCAAGCRWFHRGRMDAARLHTAKTPMC